MFPNQYFFLVFSGQWLIHNIKDDKKKAVNQCLSAAVQSSKQLFYSLHSIFRRLKLWTSLGKAICLSLVDVFVINFNCHHWFLLSWYISIKIFEFEFPEISGDEWNSIFRKLRKGDKLAGYIVQWRKIFVLRLSVSFEFLASRFQNFRQNGSIFKNSTISEGFKEISAHSSPSAKFSIFFPLNGKCQKIL